jgi:hypothetical protein
MAKVTAKQVEPGKWRWVRDNGPWGTEESIGWFSSKEEALEAEKRGQK